MSLKRVCETVIDVALLTVLIKARCLFLALYPVEIAPNESAMLKVKLHFSAPSAGIAEVEQT